MATIRIAASLFVATAFMGGCQRDAPTGATEKPGVPFSADATADASVTLNPGVIIQFVTPDDPPLNCCTTASTELVLTGESLGTIRSGNCGPASDYPVQRAVILNSNFGGGAAMMQPIIPVLAIDEGQFMPLTGPVRAGTRLRHISAQGACTDGITIYVKFQAEVQ